ACWGPRAPARARAGPSSCRRRRCTAAPPRPASLSEDRCPPLAPLCVLRLALTLLVPRVLADDADDPIPPHDLAVLAARLDARSDFHDLNMGGHATGGPPKPPFFYLNRYVIRPRVRSYGDSSTFTRSPGRMRMKFMRIFPLTCASTLCPFSSSTRNIALGSGSTTVPSTSIASSLGVIVLDPRPSWTPPARPPGSSAPRGRSRSPPRCARNAPPGSRPA